MKVLILMSFMRISKLKILKNDYGSERKSKKIKC